MIKAIKFGTPLAFNPSGNPITWYNNTFNGTFSYGKPISIMVNKGVSIRGNSCHYIWHFPETVVWIKKDKNGKSFISFKAERDIKEGENINLFKNDKGDNPKRPDYRSYDIVDDGNKMMDDETVQKITDDIPF